MLEHKSVLSSSKTVDEGKDYRESYWRRIITGNRILVSKLLKYYTKWRLKVTTFQSFLISYREEAEMLYTHHSFGQLSRFLRNSFNFCVRHNVGFVDLETSDRRNSHRSFINSNDGISYDNSEPELCIWYLPRHSDKTKPSQPIRVSGDGCS